MAVQMHAKTSIPINYSCPINQVHYSVLAFTAGMAVKVARSNLLAHSTTSLKNYIRVAAIQFGKLPGAYR
jgi:hypothetical protein